MTRECVEMLTLHSFEELEQYKYKGMKRVWIREEGEKPAIVTK